MYNKRRLLIMLASMAVLCISVGVQSIPVKESSGLLREKLLPGSIQMLPVPSDFRNYFIFQSLGAESTIIIGDFSGSDKVISVIVDSTQDGKHDKVTDYYPDTKKPKYPTNPQTDFYSDFSQMRDEIISGSSFSTNYSYSMFSLPMLKSRLKAGKDIYEWKFGYNVKIYDPDNPSTMMGEYFFSRKDGSYTLIFATYYFKLYKTKIIPPLYYSVFCSETKDPRVKAVVDELYSIANAK